MGGNFKFKFFTEVFKSPFFVLKLQNLLRLIFHCQNVKLGSRVPQFLHKPSIIEEEEEQIENLVIDENSYNSDNNDDGMFDEEDEVTVLYDKDHPSLLSCQKLIKHEISEGSEGNPPENADPAPGIGGGVGDTDKYNLDDYDLDYDSSDLLNPNQLDF